MTHLTSSVCRTRHPKLTAKAAPAMKALVTRVLIIVHYITTEAGNVCRTESFDAVWLAGQSLEIEAAYLNKRLADLNWNEDLSRYVL